MHKVSCLYIIDAIARAGRERARKEKSAAAERGEIIQKDRNAAGLLAKMEVVMERLVDDMVEEGIPEHIVSAFNCVQRSLLLLLQCDEDRHIESGRACTWSTTDPTWQRP